MYVRLNLSFCYLAYENLHCPTDIILDSYFEHYTCSKYIVHMCRLSDSGKFISCGTTYRMQRKRTTLHRHAAKLRNDIGLNKLSLKLCYLPNSV